MTDTPRLPATWRPRRTRVIAYTMAGVLVLGMIVLAIVVAPPFKLFDRVLLVAFGLFLGWLLHMFARCRVTADEAGLTVVNPFRTRRLAWPEIVRVTMGAGDPWPTLDLADGTSLSAMGVNASEKPRATHHLAELRALLAERAEAPDR